MVCTVQSDDSESLPELNLRYVVTLSVTVSLKSKIGFLPILFSRQATNRGKKQTTTLQTTRATNRGSQPRECFVCYHSSPSLRSVGLSLSLSLWTLATFCVRCLFASRFSTSRTGLPLDNPLYITSPSLTGSQHTNILFLSFISPLETLSNTAGADSICSLTSYICSGAWFTEPAAGQHSGRLVATWPLCTRLYGQPIEPHKVQ